MFLIGIVGATFLVGLFVQDRLQPWVRRDPVLKTQADSTVTDGVLLWICAVCSLGAALAAVAAQTNGGADLARSLWILLQRDDSEYAARPPRGDARMRLATDKLDGLRAKVKASKS
jgi:hypothetical protein